MRDLEIGIYLQLNCSRMSRNTSCICRISLKMIVNLQELPVNLSVVVKMYLSFEWGDFSVKGMSGNMNYVPKTRHFTCITVSNEIQARRVRRTH
jgi:hypothetical protein